MPPKFLNAPSDGKGNPHNYGGGGNEIIALNHDEGIGYEINGGGGDDIITGADFADAGLTLGSDDTLIGGAGSDVIIGGLGDDTIYGGEDEAGTDSAKGKNAVVESTLIGDVDFATNLQADYTGGNDHLFGSDGGANQIFGDTQDVSFFSASTFTGGNDELRGGDSDGTTAADNSMYGDANRVTLTGGTFDGGNDTMTGGSGVGTVNDMYGDGRLTSGAGTLTGGADIMTGGADATNNMYGDALRAVGITSATGGDDTLTGGSGANATNRMYGDFDVVTGSDVIGGNDTLISGTNANDIMTGDFGSDDFTNAIGGNDTFVFGADNGNDTITDFVSGEDVIDLSGTAVIWDSLDTDQSGILDADDLYVSIVDGNTVIDLGAAAVTNPAGEAGINLLTVEGVTGLVESDFSLQIFD